MKTKRMNQKTNRWIIIGKGVSFALFVGFVLFVVIQFRSTWQGPRIELSYPLPGQTIHDPILIISGTAHNVAQLSVFGRDIPIQLKTNRFVDEIALPQGVSSIVLDGYTRSGNHTRTIIPINYQPLTDDNTTTPNIELLQKLDPTETPFRATSDLLETIQQTQ